MDRRPSRQPTAPAPASAVAGQKRAATHGSSAYSASANPDEDWTKITDLAERRRIQNRIAQRNYRKKLKRRLESLEHVASTGSTSPERQDDEIAVRNAPPQQRKRAYTVPHPSPANTDGSRQLSPYLPPDQPHSQHAQWTTLPQPQMRHTSPLPQTLAYSSWPPQEFLTVPASAPYKHGYQTSTCSSSADDSTMYQSTAATFATTLPSMECLDGRDFMQGPESDPFRANFDAGSTADSLYWPSYQDAQSYTPPLSEDCVDYSSVGSPLDTLWNYPRTPESRCDSPIFDLFWDSTETVDAL